MSYRFGFAALSLLSASTMIVSPAAAACPAFPAWNQVIVYSDKDRGGSCAVLGVGEYPHSPFGSGSDVVDNDRLSSISLGWGVKAILYQHGNFEGNRYHYTNGPFTFNLNGWANDDVSSIKVAYRVNSSSPPANFWDSLPKDRYLSFPYSASATNSATNGSTQTFDLGNIKVGTTIRVGTCSAGGDLPNASASGDTYLRVFFNGTEQASDDDTCSPSGGSYLSYTVPYTGNVTIKAGCYTDRACSGNLQVAYGEPDSNGSVTDVVGAFNAMSGNSPRRNKLNFGRGGRVLGAYTYSLAHEPHFQGLQRFPKGLSNSPDGSPKFIFSGSDNADLYTTQFEINYTPLSGLVGPQVFPLPEGTKVIGNASYGSYYDGNGRGHLGGIQASGRWLAGGIEKSGGSGPSTLRFWDLTQLPNPLHVREIDNQRGASSAVALTKLPGKNQGFVMFVGGQDGEGAQVWTLDGQYGYADLVHGNWIYRGLVNIPEVDYGHNYSTLNFVNQDNGELFLVGTVGVGSTNPEAGSDQAVLFKVSRNGSAFSVQLLTRKTFICDFAGARNCAFNAASGIFVDPDLNAVRLYGSKAYRPDDNNANLTFVEFY